MKTVDSAHTVKLVFCCGKFPDAIQVFHKPLVALTLPANAQGASSSRLRETVYGRLPHLRVQSMIGTVQDLHPDSPVTVAYCVAAVKSVACKGTPKLPKVILAASSFGDGL